MRCDFLEQTPLDSFSSVDNQTSKDDPLAKYKEQRLSFSLMQAERSHKFTKEYE